MLSGMLATALLAPAQPPAPATPPAQPAPTVPAPAAVGMPPSIDPAPPGVCAGEAPGGFSFNTTHNGPPWAVWGGADYRMYWLRPTPSPGVLALANGVPFGGTESEFGRTDGVGFELGGWLNCRHTVGLSASGFLLDSKTRTASVAGPGTIVRPFTDALLAQPASFVVNDPASGIVGSLATEQGIRLSGFEINGLNNLANECNWSADYIFGFRYLDLDEFLTVTQRSTVPGAVGLPLAGTRLNTDADVTISDRFRTRSQFFGGQTGLRGEYRFGDFFAGLSTKVGIGNVHQRVDIDGRTDVVGQTAVPGGFLATPGANVGGVTTNRFAVLVDVALTAGYQFAPWGRAKVGYDFLYLNDVVRPGQQVDQTLSSRFIPTSINYNGSAGLRSPIPTGRTDDFFAHGLRFGVELMY